MMNERNADLSRKAEDIVMDRTEDLFWTIADDVNDEGRDKLDKAIDKCRGELVTILRNFSA